jgi:hypothetical protein
MPLVARNQPKREPISDPGRYLLLAIIHQAATDCTGRGMHLTPLKIQTAINFLQSGLFFEICDRLGIRPSYAKKLSQDAANGRITPIRRNRTMTKVRQ